MKSILFLRHAKSSWGSPGTADHERPLNGRGKAAAEAMAAHIAALEAPPPDLILCSTATRSRQALTPLLDRLVPAPTTLIETGLYLASEDSLLERLQALQAKVGRVLVIGHNDGMWELATALAGKGPAALLASLAEKYPTGALAVLDAPIERWPDLATGQATLTSFVCPRELGEDGQ